MKNHNNHKIVETWCAASLQNHVRTVILNDFYDYRDYINHNNQTNHAVETLRATSLQRDLFDYYDFWLMTARIP